MSIEYRLLNNACGRDASAVKQVAGIMYNWWAEECGMTMDDTILLCTRDVGFYPTALSPSLPRTWVALDGENVVGCIKLVTNDTAFRQDLYPVLSSLYVTEDHRKLGIASNLIGALLKYAFRSCSFDAVHLGTGLVGFYERFGFQFMCEDYAFFETSHGIYKDRKKDRIYRITRDRWEELQRENC